MKRRNFVRVALGAATAATVVPTCLLATEDEEEHYREAFRQRLIRLCKQGYEIKWCRLSPIRDGRRLVEVFPRARRGYILDGLAVITHGKDPGSSPGIAAIPSPSFFRRPEEGCCCAAETRPCASRCWIISVGRMLVPVPEVYRVDSRLRAA